MRKREQIENRERSFRARARVEWLDWFRRRETLPPWEQRDATAYGYGIAFTGNNGPLNSLDHAGKTFFEDWVKRAAAVRQRPIPHQPVTLSQAETCGQLRGRIRCTHSNAIH